MAVGMRIKNSAGVLQITDEIKNFALKYKGTLTPSSGLNYPYEASLNGDNLINPIVAITPGSSTQIVCLTRFTQLDSDSFNWRFACSNTTAFTYYIFDNYSTALASLLTEGAVLYDPSSPSEVIWSTAEYPLRIVGGRYYC